VPNGHRPSPTHIQRGHASPSPVPQKSRSNALPNPRSGSRAIPESLLVRRPAHGLDRPNRLGHCPGIRLPGAPTALAGPADELRVRQRGGFEQRLDRPTEGVVPTGVLGPPTQLGPVGVQMLVARAVVVPRGERPDQLQARDDAVRGRPGQRGVPATPGPALLRMRPRYRDGRPRALEFVRPSVSSSMRSSRDSGARPRPAANRARQRPRWCGMPALLLERPARCGPLASQRTRQPELLPFAGKAVASAFAIMLARSA
jgi:hypothetical protein